MIKSPTISIIVPVYNSQDFLHQCIESILNQIYIDFELLLINDGSTDKSGEICEKFAKTDNRIRVFNQKNGGVSSARNLGLNNARGKWISFVDSDDWEDKETYNEIITSINGKNIELAIWGIKMSFKTNVQNIFLQNSIFAYDKTSVQELLIQIDMIGLFGSPCNKLYLLKLIKNNDIQFDIDLSNNEDVQFNCQYLKSVSAIYAHNQPFYNYRKIFNSRTLSNTYSENILNIIQSSVDMRTDLFASYNGSYRYIYNQHLQKNVYNILLELKLKMYDKNIPAKTRRKNWKEFLKGSKIEFSKNNWYYRILNTNNAFIIDSIFKLRYYVYKYSPTFFLLFKNILSKHKELRK